MVKKYHQTLQDREDESRGMKRYWDRKEAKGHMDSEFYGMISEDHSEIANLPQDVKYKKYPKTRFMDAHELDDTIRGIDDERDETVKIIERYASDVKY